MKTKEELKKWYDDELQKLNSLYEEASKKFEEIKNEKDPVMVYNVNSDEELNGAEIQERFKATHSFLCSLSDDLYLYKEENKTINKKIDAIMQKINSIEDKISKRG